MTKYNHYLVVTIETFKNRKARKNTMDWNHIIKQLQPEMLTDGGKAYIKQWAQKNRTDLRTPEIWRKALQGLSEAQARTLFDKTKLAQFEQLGKTNAVAGNPYSNTPPPSLEKKIDH